MLRFVCAAGLVLCAVTAGCAPAPETLVRQAIHSAQEAVEGGRSHELASFFAVEFRDERGRDRDDLVRLVTNYAERNRPLYLWVVERALERAEPGAIRVELLVAAASVPLSALGDLSRAGADVASVSLEFRREPDGAWRVARADWRPASVADFLPGRR